jgi:hypothetical protein
MKDLKQNTQARLAKSDLFDKAFDFLAKRNPFEISQGEWINLLLKYSEVQGVKAVIDLAGFYDWCVANEKDGILVTFAHDFNEMGKEWFLPRTNGYAEFFKG